MKKLLRKSKSRSHSSEDCNTGGRPQFNSRRLSLPNDFSFELIHSAHGRRDNTDNTTRTSLIATDEGLSPNTSAQDNESIALSDAETLLVDKRQRLILQDTFEENFTHYLPFLMRRYRMEEESTSGNNGTMEPNHISEEFDDDDESTIYNDSIGGNFETRYNRLNSELPLGISLPSPLRTKVFDKPASSFTLKREIIVVNEFIKNNYLIFMNQESFKKFKELKSRKKSRNNSVIVYDEENNIKRLSNIENDSLLLNTHDSIGDNIIDNRSHIIPLEYKVKGEALPVFKIQTPYMSSFRKHVPYMIFKRFREVPLKPVLQENQDHDDEYESYSFCTVHLKHFQLVKRYIFNFTPLHGEKFKIILFQHNTKPFCDFEYKNTRFRIVGTSLAAGFIFSYNPNMKLFIIDQNSPSLVDKMINKSPGLEISSLLRRRSSNDDVNGSRKNSTIEVSAKSGHNNLSTNSSSPPPATKASNDPSCDLSDVSTFTNPYPDPSCPLLEDCGTFCYGIDSISSRSYIPNDSPPFASFKDAQSYTNQSFLPKKYAENGKIEIYQDINTFTESNHNESSTLSIDLDTLVLNVIILTLMENNLRNANKNGTSGFATRLSHLPNIPTSYNQFTMSASVL